jgi:hypothetical protein
MKRYGAGVLGTGFFAFGFALAVGVVSVGVNAVGWIAIGLNAAGFVSIGLVNAVGVFTFAGVNALGGWGGAFVNGGISRWVGLFFSVATAAVVSVLRARSWPRGSEPPLVSLATALEGGGDLARARLGAMGEEVVVMAGGTTGRVRATAERLARCQALGEGASVLVGFKQSAVAVEGAGYREDAASLVLELAEVLPDPRPTFLAALFGGRTGVHLICAWLGLAAAVAAFVWF